MGNTFQINLYGEPMTWMETSVVDQRLEFVMLACASAASVSELYRRFGISRKTGYKWLGR